MKLSNLSVGLRLGASFGAILLITALIAATGMWRIASLQGASERVATQEIEQQTLVENWASDIRLNWVRTEAFLKAIDRDYMEKLTADTQATAKGIEGKVQRIEGLVHGDKNRAQLATIAAASKAYNDKLAEIRELHRGGEPNVPTLVDKDLRPLADKYLQSLDDLRTAMAAQLADSQGDTSTLAKASQVLLGVGTLIAVALGALLAFTVTRSIVQPVQRGKQAAESIADGDLTHPIEASGNDETGQLLQALATMQSRLATIVGNVRHNAEGVATASVEIASGNNDLSARTEQQASALQQTAASMEELGSTVRQNADNARTANQLAMSASTVAQQGGDVVGEVVASIRRVTEIMGEISAASSEQSQGVSQVGEAITQMDQATQQNAALVEQSAAAADSLKTQAGQLVDAVAVFRLSANTTRHGDATPAPARGSRISASRLGYRAGAPRQLPA